MWCQKNEKLCYLSLHANHISLGWPSYMVYRNGACCIKDKPIQCKFVNFYHNVSPIVLL